MFNNTPKTTPRRNGLVMLAEDKAESSGKPQSIREFLRENPMGSRMMYELCEKNGIDLDSPWPPQFSREDAPAAPEPPKPRTERQRPAALPVSSPAQHTAEIIQFPLPFGEETRAVSNAMARCALFAPVKERAFFRDYVVVGEIDGYLIDWKGEQLNQDDHDTLLQLVKMARHKPFGVDVIQPVNILLRGLNRQNHKEQRRQFFEQCDRIKSGTIRITPKGKPSYTGNLIIDIITPQDQKTEPQYRRFFSYQLNPKLSGLYNNNAFSLVDWRERVKIKGRGSELAKWLHLWIISHTEQYPHRVETIREKCGSKDKILYSFRQKLRLALDLLKEAGIITAWHIDEADLVHIQRTPSAAQIGHLTKKAAKTPKRPKV